jgi:hypothetical protein
MPTGLRAHLPPGPSPLRRRRAPIYTTHCGLTLMSACNSSFVGLLLFRRLLGEVRREFMQRLLVALYFGTLGSYLRDALREGRCCGMPSCHSGLGLLGYLLLLLFAWWLSLLFILVKILI